jgi:hypothetical protein
MKALVPTLNDFDTFCKAMMVQACIIRYWAVGEPDQYEEDEVFIKAVDILAPMMVVVRQCHAYRQAYARHN